MVASFAARIVRHAPLLAFALLAATPALSAARLFIASDSTAQDYPPEKYPQVGWGTMLRCALDDTVAVENRAIAGRSTRSFINEGRLDDIARDIRAGDTLLIQFGHNDANAQKPERYTSVPDYKLLLRRYIETATRLGARAVLLTPVTRRNWIDGRITPSFPAYSQAAREVARETGTPLIDLDTLSERWVQGLGVEESRRFFLADDTHFTELGARHIANIVAGGLAGLALPVSAHVRRDSATLLVDAPLGGSSCETAPGASLPRTYRFAGKARPGEIPVPAGRAYGQGYGFEPGSASLFSVALPDGEYRVTVTFGDPHAAADTAIEAEARRLMMASVHTAPGQFVTRSFVVSVRTPTLPPLPDNAPGGHAVRINAHEQGSLTWDDKLTLAWRGKAPRVATVAIAPARVPTLFLFGDSTVTDQRTAPYRSWGQVLPAMIGTSFAVSNHAEAGETLKSFLTGLRLDKALAAMQPGDFAMIQFGHNDQKSQWPQTYAAAASTYRAWLRAYIAEVRLHGATPVLVTSPERRNFTAAGTIQPTLGEYAEAVRAVAAEEKVQLIDLNAASIRIYETLGPARAPAAFADNGRDATHHDDYGAWLMAWAVADAMRADGGPLAKFIAAELPPMDLQHLPPPEIAAQLGTTP